MIYITGDTHRRFSGIAAFCEKHKTTKQDIMIILGDAGINFFSGRCDDYKDVEVKRKIEETLPITLFCIHGNHEQRPFAIPTYEEYVLDGDMKGIVYREKEFPSILFAKDGEIYDILGQKAVVIGGAYSIDKYYRLMFGHPWFDTEQPSDEIKEYVEEQLEKEDWAVDYVFSHTAPKKYEPTESFSDDIDQSRIDKSTEEWLDKIEEKLDYQSWYCGHYHIEKDIEKMHFRFGRIETLSL